MQQLQNVDFGLINFSSFDAEMFKCTNTTDYSNSCVVFADFTPTLSICTSCEDVTAFTIVSLSTKSYKTARNI